jgi:hypothetical protein
VNLQYRKNLAEFNAWEEKTRRDQAEAIAALLRRERKGLRVPRWLVVVVSIAAAAVFVWAFIALAFSF